MEKLLPTIRNIADRIADTERRRKRLALMLRKQPGHGISRVQPDRLESVKVVGVDGGIAKKSLHGVDCMLARAAGVCFEYSKGRVASVRYYPSKIPSPQPAVLEALSDMDWGHYAASIRLLHEIVTATKSVDVFRPDALLLDGQIIPHYADRPSRTSPVYQNYADLISNYLSLYKKVEENGVLLAGVIEDSRNVRFCDIIKKAAGNAEIPRDLMALLDRTKDTNLLFWMLEKGERTSVFSHADNPDNNKVLKDLGGFGGMVKSFYIKTAQWDRPIKVDFLSGKDEDHEKKADRIGSIILAISGHHSGYGLPAPLIEADSVAKMSESEIDNFYSQVLTFAGNMPSIMKLRREQRPF
ncbi:MAG: DNA double-strand break repair nuclease NurA [Candidatus Aenigmarchaeota archaeon]|nr:DNA double-strand break repair nuclease NurA [Candidatus Aenigmarchaeota archaeon]